MNSKRLFLSFSTAILCLLFWSCNYDNSIQPETATITGETFGLNGTEPKHFLYDVKRISAVYGYDDMGNKIYFSADDYDVDLNRNTIARTINSAMPDFAAYSVNFNETEPLHSILNQEIRRYLVNFKYMWIT